MAQSICKKTVAVFALSGLLACGEETQKSPPLGRFRCADEGLCVVSNTDKVLSGAFRSESREVAFDSIFRGQPWMDSLMGGRDYCERIVLDTGHMIYNVTGGYCPAEWSDARLPGPPDDIDAYVPMLENMAAAMKAQQPPRGRWQDGWNMIITGVEHAVASFKNPPVRSEHEVVIEMSPDGIRAAEQAA